MNPWDWIRDMGSDNRFIFMVWAVTFVAVLGVLTVALIIWTALELAGVV